MIKRSENNYKYRTRVDKPHICIAANGMGLYVANDHPDYAEIFDWKSINKAIIRMNNKWGDHRSKSISGFWNRKNAKRIAQ